MKKCILHVGCAIPVSLCDCCGSRRAVPVLPWFFMFAVFVLLPPSALTGVIFLLVVLVLATGSDFSSGLFHPDWIFLMVIVFSSGFVFSARWVLASERVFPLRCGLARELAWSGSWPYPVWSWCSIRCLRRCVLLSSRRLL
jgi:hypothetical protein